MALFEPARHEPLAAGPWDEMQARAGIAAIVADACARFDERTLWPRHPRDIEPGDPQGRPAAGLYDGAAGVIWALDRLRERGHASPSFDAIKPSLVEYQHRYTAEADSADRRSFLLGDAGILLLQHRSNGSPDTADALYALVEANLHHPARDQLWGSPGTLVAALHMLEATGEERWLDVFRRGVDLLWDEMEPLAGHDDVWIWTQQLGGRDVRYIGAGHGFAGNVYPVLRGARWLSAAQVDAFEARTLRALQALAIEEDGCINWEPVFDRVERGWPIKLLMQDCHGAPGIVCRLAESRMPALQALLVRAGEAVWRAGPMSKGAGLCHGTAGNGYAFLKLHRMTGDTRWLDRARAFAMHALMQVEREAALHGQRWLSLWTGDLGVAMYVSSCLDADDRLPSFDWF